MHRKRYPIQSNLIDFTTNMRLDCRKDLFLSNSKNKQAFVNLLATRLVQAAHEVIQTEGDADREIVDLILQ